MAMCLIKLKPVRYYGLFITFLSFSFLPCSFLESCGAAIKTFSLSHGYYIKAYEVAYVQLFGLRKLFHKALEAGGSLYCCGSLMLLFHNKLSGAGLAGQT